MDIDLPAVIVVHEIPELRSRHPAGVKAQVPQLENFSYIPTTSKCAEFKVVQEKQVLGDHDLKLYASPVFGNPGNPIASFCHWGMAGGFANCYLKLYLVEVYGTTFAIASKRFSENP